MSLSRLRLRLAGSFALAFLAGLLLLSVTLFLYSHRQSDRRFTQELATEAGEMAGAIRIEYSLTPADGIRGAVDEALAEWPARPEAFGIYTMDGVRIGTTGPASLVKWLPDTLAGRSLKPRDFRRSRPHVRVFPIECVRAPVSGGRRGHDAARLDSETEAFAFWLFSSIPVTVLVESRRGVSPVPACPHAE